MWTKAWQNKRPGWTRRVRWYPMQNGMVRLEFMERNSDDTERQRHSITVSLEEATVLYDRYARDDTVTGRDVFFSVMEAREG